MKSRDEILAGGGNRPPFETSVLELLCDIRDVLVKDFELRREFLSIDEPENAVLEDQRNDALIELALRVLTKVNSPTLVREQLMAYNQQLCSPPLPDSEVEEIVQITYKLSPEEVQRKLRSIDDRRDQYIATNRRRGK